LLRAALAMPWRAMGVVIGGAGAAAMARTSGYRPGTDRRLAAVSPWQFAVLQHAAKRIAAPDRPQDGSIPSADTLDVARFVDGWMARMPERARRDFGRFLLVVEYAAPLRLGFASRFTRLSPARQDEVLAALEASWSDLLRAGFQGLKSLVYLGFYSDRRSWSVIGYDGPRVGRPAAGWGDGMGSDAR
ncbi:MAG: gluconate 2-dehydrogenase subunit 3 family protein, partial [Polyangiaceae bacterium]